MGESRSRFSHRPEGQRFGCFLYKPTLENSLYNFFAEIHLYDWILHAFIVLRNPVPHWKTQSSIIEWEYPGAITASLSEHMTDENEVRRLFVEWIGSL